MANGKELPHSVSWHQWERGICFARVDPSSIIKYIIKARIPNLKVYVRDDEATNKILIGIVHLFSLMWWHNPEPTRVSVLIKCVIGKLFQFCRATQTMYPHLLVVERLSAHEDRDSNNETNWRLSSSSYTSWIHGSTDMYFVLLLRIHILRTSIS